MPLDLRVLSPDLAATHRRAAELATLLRPGDVLCLAGDLGAGKTAFVEGLARALGVVEDVVSPTFTLENRYPVPGGGALSRLVHCDLYRPGDDARRDLLPSMLEAREQGALLAIEWADPVEAWLQPYLALGIRVLSEEGGRGEPVRELRLRDVPEGWPRAEELRRRWTAEGE